jgi:autotransporter translocation and assembly factor TamB
MGLKRTLFKSLAVGLVTTSGLVAAGLLYAHTQSGLDQISRLVNAVTKDTATPVVLGRMQGSLLHDLHVDSVSVADRYGVWLDIKDAHLVWSPVALLTGQYGIKRIDVAHMGLHRLPDMEQETQPEESKKTKSSSFSLESVNPILPRSVQVQDIHISGAVTKSAEQILNLRGIGKGKAYGLRLTTQQGPQTMLTASALLSNKKPELNVTLKEEPLGILGRVLQLPTDSTLSAHVKLNTDTQKIIQLHEADIQIASLSIKGDGRYNLRNQQVAGRLTAQLGNLSDWQELAQVPMSGTVSVDMHAEGPLQALVAGGDITTQSVDIQGNAVPDVTVTVQSVLNALAKSFDAKVTHTPITLSSVYDGGLQGDVINDVHVRGNIDIFEGELVSALKNAHGDSVMRIEAQANRPEQIYSAQAKGELVHQKHVFDVSTALSVDKNIVHVADLLLQGPGMDVKSQAEINLNTLLAQGDVNIQIDDLKPFGEFLQQDITGQTKAHILLSHEQGKQQAAIQIDALKLRAAEQAIALQKPASFVWNDKGMVLEPFQLSVNGDTISGQGSLSDNHVQADIVTRNFSFARFVPGLTEGRTNLDLHIKGTAEKPIIDMKAKGNLKTEELPLQFDITAGWIADNVSVQAKAVSQGAVIDASTQLKSTLSLMPFKTDMSAQTALSGRVQANMPLESLNPFLWPAGHRVAGHMNGNFALSGHVGDPKFNGQAVLKDVSYDHVQTGICLRHVNGALQASQDRIAVRNLTATDEDKRKLAVNVTAQLAGAQAFQGVIALDRFKLFCGGLATGIIDGDVRATGTLKNMLIGGKLVLGPLNVQLPGAQNDTEIPSVKTIRVRKDKGQEEPPAKISLNIALDAPNQIFIRGRGLDAEFGGALSITGEATSPAVAGKFSSRRGTFNFLDRVLSLTKGELNFAGPIPPSPILNIVTETKVRSHVLNVSLDGSVTAPKLSLSSQPSLPQDEVLALLLFGRQLQAISPFEALKLAQATRTLAGLDGGEPGILDKARAALGLDVLNVSTSDNNEVTVSTGKYVTDKVFVGVQQGTRPEDKVIKTEIEVTPSVTANTTVDGNANQGVGLGWRYDY